MTDTPENLIAAVRYFSDLDVCNRYMKRIKWPDGDVVCPHCKSERNGNDGNRFDRVMQGIIGKRLTYRQLCAIGDAGFMGIE